MEPRATHPPILAYAGTVVVAAKPMLRHVAILAVAVALLPGCWSASGQTSKKAPRAPKTFRQATSGARPSGSAKRNESRRAPAAYEPTEEQSAVTAIVGIGKPAVPDLVKTLRSENPVARRQAALALSRIGPDAKDAVDELIVALDDQDPAVRKAAARALGNIGSAAERAVPYLVRVMSGEPADATMDDEYSVAPPRIESRSNSAKTQDRFPAADQAKTKNPNYSPPVSGSEGDDVVIESTGGPTSEEVRPADYESEAEASGDEASEDEQETLMDDETENGHAATDESTAPPGRFSAPSKLRPKGPMSPKGKP